MQPLGLIQCLDSEERAPETADFAHVRDNLKAVQVGGARGADGRGKWCRWEGQVVQVEGARVQMGGGKGTMM